jgi:hypothetical protein
MPVPLNVHVCYRHRDFLSEVDPEAVACSGVTASSFDGSVGSLLACVGDQLDAEKILRRPIRPGWIGQTGTVFHLQLNAGGGYAHDLEPRELRSMIRQLRRRITRSWHAEEILRCRMPMNLPEQVYDADRERISWDHLHMTAKQQLLYDDLCALGHDRSLDEHDLLACETALVDWYDQTPVSGLTV